jgi:hypothetical protein
MTRSFNASALLESVRNCTQVQQLDSNISQHNDSVNAALRISECQVQCTGQCAAHSGKLNDKITTAPETKVGGHIP